MRGPGGRISPAPSLSRAKPWPAAAGSTPLVPLMAAAVMAVGLLGAPDRKSENGVWGRFKLEWGAHLRRPRRCLGRCWYNF